MKQAHNQPVENRPETNSESGYLMAAGAVLILVITAILSSFSFVAGRENRFQANYATGQRLAFVAVQAHSYAQSNFYNETSPLDLDAAGDLFGALGLPDNFKFRGTTDTDFSIEVVGKNEAPINNSTPTAVKAPSAYLHFRIRKAFSNAKRAPSDTIAFLSGASSKGMNRVGFVGMNIPAGDSCDGGATAVRWGPEASSCLNNGQVSANFSDVQQGDIIVPAWETALARGNRDVIYRYKQPERPSLNTMNTGLNMNAFAIEDALDTNADTITATGVTEMLGDMVVREGENTTINQAITNDSFRVYNQDPAATTPSLIVSGPVAFVGGFDLNVGERLDHGGGELNVNAENPVATQQLGDGTTDMLVTPIDAVAPAPANTLQASIRKVNPLSDITGLTMANDNARFIVTGALNAENAALLRHGNLPLDMYAAELTTRNTASIRNATDDLTWNVGSIEQKGTAGALTVPHLRATNDCIGIGCPDNVTTPPGDGGL